MEVLFISHKYPPSIGGMQKQSYELINCFDAHGVAHHIVLSPEENRVTFFLRLRRRVSQMITEHPSIRLIHCNDGVCGVMGQLLLSSFDLPLVVTFHGLDLLWPNKLYQRWLQGGGISQYAGVIGVSDFTSQAAVDRGARSSVVRTVLNGVDQPDWDINEVRDSLKEFIKGLKHQNKRILVSIGRPVRRKGFNWFIQEVLTQLSSDVYYIVIGPKVERSFLHKMWRAIVPDSLLRQIDLFFGSNSAQGTLEHLVDQYEHQVNWLSDLNYNEVQYMLSQATLMVMPNIAVEGDAEGFGLVSLEANMHGTYVLAADVDGIPSAIHDGHNGTLIEAGSSDRWVAEIDSFLGKSQQTILEKGRSAQAYVESTFSWRKMAAEYHDFFKQIAGQLDVSEQKTTEEPTEQLLTVS